MQQLLGYAQIAVGALITALGLNLFYIPSNLMEGGLTGIALLSHYLWGLPVGGVYAALNLPLLVATWRVWGREGLMKTIWGTFALSAAIEATAGLRIPTPDIWLATLYGAVLAGLGLGIIFRAGGTTGGTDIVARLVWRYFGIEMGRTLFAIDLVVMGLSGYFFGHVVMLYSLVATFVATRVIDVVQEGLYAAKALTIFSDRPREIAAALMQHLERGVTLYPAVGAYTGQTREVVYCVVGRAEVSRAKALVYALDPRAFVVVTDVHEVMGEGFQPPPAGALRRSGAGAEAKGPR
ncbi:MAG: YitT family protein [Firmicutes bacterium]|nr:YitT family protein [Bacillota bacterium]